MAGVVVSGLESGCLAGGILYANATVDPLAYRLLPDRDGLPCGLRVARWATALAGPTDAPAERTRTHGAAHWRSRGRRVSSCGSLSGSAVYRTAVAPLEPKARVCRV